jgi:hypothetical protein
LSSANTTRTTKKAVERVNVGQLNPELERRRVPETELAEARGVLGVVRIFRTGRVGFSLLIRRTILTR